MKIENSVRGLDSLIPQKRGDNENEKVSPRESVFMIEVDKISPNPLQPRKEFDEQELKDLAASIRQFGILQPLIVTKVEKETAKGRDVEYELIAGERRLKAAKMANLPRVPVVVRRSTTPEKLAISVIENIQRQNLNPVELGRAYQMLNKKFGMTNKEIARQVGKHETYVGNLIRILSLPEEMIQSVTDGKVSLHNTRYLTGLSRDPEKQRKLYEEIITHNLDTFGAERKLWELQKKDEKPALRASGIKENPELVSIASKLKKHWSIEWVRVNRFGGKARVFIEFPTQKLLEEWAKRIMG